MQLANGLFRHCVAMFPGSELLFTALSMAENEEEWRTKESYSQSCAGSVTFEGEEKKRSREHTPSDQALQLFMAVSFMEAGSRQAGKLPAN